MRPSLRLTLYTAGRRHAQVASALREIVRQALGPRTPLDVVDVHVDPQSAEADNILATPTLVVASGRSSRRLIGDFSNREMVVAWLRTTPHARL